MTYVAKNLKAVKVEHVQIAGHTDERIVVMTKKVVTNPKDVAGMVLSLLNHFGCDTAEIYTANLEVVVGTLTQELERNRKEMAALDKQPEFNGNLADSVGSAIKPYGKKTAKPYSFEDQ